ncbi:MAG TPA: hypothetical protein VIU39_00765 [Anaerolineales bacterium]
MNIEEFVQSIRNIFRHKDNALPDDVIKGLIRSLEEGEAEQGCSCDDVFAVVDQYAEIELRGQDAARLMPLLRKHMDGCHDCCEEYEALLDILQHSNPEQQ